MNNNSSSSCNHLHPTLYLLLLNQLLVTAAAPVVTRITGAASQVIKMNNDATLLLWLGVAVHDDDDGMASFSSSSSSSSSTAAAAAAAKRLDACNHFSRFWRRRASAVGRQPGGGSGGWSVSAFHGYRTLSLSPTRSVCVCVCLASLVFIIIFPFFFLSFLLFFCATIQNDVWRRHGRRRQSHPLLFFIVCLCLTDPVVENTETKHAHIYTRAPFSPPFPSPPPPLSLSRLFNNKRHTRTKQNPKKEEKSPFNYVTMSKHAIHYRIVRVILKNPTFLNGSFFS